MGDVPAAPVFATAPDTPPPGLVRRVLQTQRHLAGVLVGALIASVDTDRRLPRARRHALFGLRRAVAALLRPFIARDLRHLPFPVQFRRRLELLGATYIKLGQILSLREDLLPPEITSELKNLLDRLPAVPYDRVVAIIEATLQRPVIAAFASVERTPIGSASIGQVHRATTIGGDAVIVKIVKPGIRETLERDAVLLRVSGAILNWVVPRFRPKQVFAEFVEYTLREVDLRREADNAETFATNFSDLPDIVFPRIYRELSGRDVLTMEFLDGVKPSDVGATMTDGRARHAHRPRRDGDHPDAVSRRVLPRRPAPGQPDGAAGPEVRVHRPRHGRAVRRGPAPGADVLLLLPRGRRRRERGALPVGRRRARAGRRSARLQARRRGRGRAAGRAPRRSATSRWRA